MTNRIASLDLFRGIMVVLMVFMRDLDTLTGVPNWFRHARPGEDFLGLSDIIFPCFLFIVGASIPFALKRRLSDGESRLSIIRHIALRAVSLMIMGAFLLNMANWPRVSDHLSLPYFAALVFVCFFLVWGSYGPISDRRLVLGGRAVGIAGLIVAIWLYGGVHSDGLRRGFEPGWFGILGQIGISYLLFAPVFLFGRKRVLPIALLMTAGSVAVNLILSSSYGDRWTVDWSPEWFVGNGSLQALVGLGIVVSQASGWLLARSGPAAFVGVLVSSAVALTAAVFVSHQYFIVSKISGTPTWLFASAAICTTLFAVLYVVVDWLRILPSSGFANDVGRNALTCYIIPFMASGFLAAAGFSFPRMISVGYVGLGKSLVWALCLTAAAQGMSRLGVRLRV